MLRIVVKRFIIYGGIFSAINFSAWSAEYTPSWSQRQQQSAACFMTGDETCMTFIDDAVRLPRGNMANAQYSLFVACYYKVIFINGWVNLN
ncbi:Uncharacterised protein [Salmonella enterica subsp. enterica]|nr:Uncharacterised protein [Salmonella enterica subsp. enterica]